MDLYTQPGVIFLTDGSVQNQEGDRCPLVTDDGNVNTQQGEVEEGDVDEEVKMETCTN